MMPERAWLPKVKRARLVYHLEERSVRIREVEGSNPSFSASGSPVIAMVTGFLLCFFPYFFPYSYFAPETD